MATKYSTGNPVGSSDPRDLFDNSIVIDEFANSSGETAVDRRGVSRKTLTGLDAEFDASQVSRESEFDASQADKAQRFNQLLAASGYVFLADYAAGIEITEYNEVIRDGSGNLWRAASTTTLPYTTDGTGLPEGGAFVSAGDAVLRNDLAQDSQASLGSALVGHRGETVRSALDQRTIYVGSVAELEALSLSVGTAVYLTEEGRAGEFVVKAGTAPSDPQKGIYIVLANGNYAQRQFTGATHVKWFGAVGDGVADDSAAIQAAADSIGSVDGFLSSGGINVEAAESSLFFSGGVYLISAELVINKTYLKILGENTVLKKTGTPEYILSNRNAYYVQIEGLIFDTTTKAVRIRNNNLDRGKVTISNCSFEGCSDSIIAYSSTEPVSGDVSANSLRSSVFMVRECRFSSARLGKVYSDGFVIENCWASAHPIEKDLDYFVDLYGGGKCIINGLLGVPNTNIDTTAFKDFAWINRNGGQLRIEKSRFGAEFGGMTVLNNIDSLSEVVIDQCLLQSFRPISNSNGDPESAIIRAFGQQGPITIEKCFWSNDSNRQIIVEAFGSTVSYGGQIVLSNNSGFVSTFPRAETSFSEKRLIPFDARRGDIIYEYPYGSFQKRWVQVEAIRQSGSIARFTILNWGSNGDVFWTTSESSGSFPVSISHSAVGGTISLTYDDDGVSSQDLAYFLISSQSLEGSIHS